MMIQFTRSVTIATIAHTFNDDHPRRSEYFDRPLITDGIPIQLNNETRTKPEMLRPRLRARSSRNRSFSKFVSLNTAVIRLLPTGMKMISHNVRNEANVGN